MSRHISCTYPRPDPGFVKRGGRVPVKKGRVANIAPKSAEFAWLSCQKGGPVPIRPLPGSAPAYPQVIYSFGFLKSHLFQLVCSWPGHYNKVHSNLYTTPHYTSHYSITGIHSIDCIRNDPHSVNNNQCNTRSLTWGKNVCLLHFDSMNLRKSIARFYLCRHVCVTKPRHSFCSPIRLP